MLSLDFSPETLTPLAVTRRKIKINFQTASSPVPTGYTKDSGQAFNSTRGFGWIAQGSRQPLNISGNTRDRNLVNTDQRLDSLIHMQLGTTAAWEHTVANGLYSVTVSVGDVANGSGVYDSKHTIRVEGVTAIDRFQASNTQKYHLASVTVNVTDGRLTIDPGIGANAGINTKINFLEIVPISAGNHPRVPDSFPRTLTKGINRDAAISVDVFLPNVGQGVNPATLNSTNVQLYRTFDNSLVSGNINTTGGGDAIVFQPTGLLQANTNYTFRITEGVKDQSGASFLPFSMTFTTGDAFMRSTPGVNFAKNTVYTGAPVSSLEFGPDNRLYAATLDGKILRWTISTTGRLTNLQTFAPGRLAGRAIIGIVFDPKNPNSLWISHNDPLVPQPADDFSGKISKITLGSGSGFNASVQDYVVGLPRSAKDHLSQSLAFDRLGNKLYLSQGSNTAMGEKDAAWFNRPERLLSGAILQIDPSRTNIPVGGFNVQTQNYGGRNGTYDPFAANAPVKIFATGIRNAYDLVWHSNGFLYVPTNGSAAGGNTPEHPTRPGDQGLNNVATQHDFLFKIEPGGGGYYGHPNSLRGEYILNGGNPTTGDDPAEVAKPSPDSPYSGYAPETAPDRNYRGFAYDFGRNRSPNGTIEYMSNRFGGALKNKLLVAEYSGGDDILALNPGSGGNIARGSVTKVISGLKDPLDLIEDTRNGNLYVAELPRDGINGGQITLLS